MLALSTVSTERFELMPRRRREKRQEQAPKPAVDQAPVSVFTLSTAPEPARASPLSAPRPGTRVSVEHLERLLEKNPRALITLATAPELDNDVVGLALVAEHLGRLADDELAERTLFRLARHASPIVRNGAANGLDHFVETSAETRGFLRDWLARREADEFVRMTIEQVLLLDPDT